MRNRYVFLLDLVMIAVAACTAFILRFDWWAVQSRSEALTYVGAALVFKPIVFYLFGLYRRYWRYTSVSDLPVLAVAVTVATAVMGLFVSLALRSELMPGFSRAVVVIDALLTLLAVCGVRLSVRVIAESKPKVRETPRALLQRDGFVGPRRVLVVGAGDAGVMVVREMQRNPHLEMLPVGFLDDDASKYGKRIYDVPVLGNLRALGRIVRIARVEEVIIAMPTAPGTAIRSIVEACQTLQIPSRTMPGVYELLDGQVSVDRLRNVEITDLLKRPQVTSRGGADYLTGKTVLVTGAGGSIGSELCRQVAHVQPKQIVMVGHGENSLYEAHARLKEELPEAVLHLQVADIRDRTRIQRIFSRFAPEVVFHAAAHKHVDLMEENFEEAISNNVIGTQNLVDAALASNTHRFVAISTDKAVSPVGLMGASKRMSGIIVREAGRCSGRGFIVVRFGNVLGSRGSVVPHFKRQIERGGPVTVTHPEMQRFFMTISEAVHLVLEAGSIGRGGDLYVLNMGKPVKIIELARDLIRLSGYTLDQIPIEVTGCRPGEKLSEQLWEPHAVVERTSHPDVLKVTEHEASIPAGALRPAIRALESAVTAGDRLRIEATLCEWIPSFTPPVALLHQVTTDSAGPATDSRFAAGSQL